MGTSITYTEQINDIQGSIAILGSAKDKLEKLFSCGTKEYIMET